MRLILHTGAYWLLLDLRAAIPSWNPAAEEESETTPETGNNGYQ